MTEMTPAEENDFYSEPENLAPQGPAHRRSRSRLGDPVPVRLPADVLAEARRRAAADDRSLSGWIQRAVEHELSRPAS